MCVFLFCDFGAELELSEFSRLWDSGDIRKFGL